MIWICKVCGNKESTAGRIFEPDERVILYCNECQTETEFEHHRHRSNPLEEPEK